MILEQFFARTLLQDDYSEPRAQFLMQLMEVSRQGHLCWKTSEISPVSIASLNGAVVQDGDRYYLRRNWDLETKILAEVSRLSATLNHSDYDEERFLVLLEQSPLLAGQREVVHHALKRRFALICGGPGTGKTFTAAQLVKLLAASCKKERYKVALSAPTGKAAMHLHAGIMTIPGVDFEAQTIHRLLRLSPGEYRLSSKRKIDADLVIVDEASMIDVVLLAQLLDATPSDTRLILLGDPDQLPPVEAGSLFAEMAELFGLFLKESKRTSCLKLQRCAQMVNRGEFDFDGMYRQDLALDASLAKRLFEIMQPICFWQEPNPEECLANLHRLRVLGALRQGPFGIDALNQQIVQEAGRHIRPGQWWVIPIMVTTNDIRQELYNGTCGVLIGKSRGGVFLQDGTAYFPQTVPYAALPPYEVAFCLSIHKSQGSEFDHVIALLPPGSESFGKEALYTAVTRAKHQVEIVGQEDTLREMLSKRSRKVSGFTERYTRS